MPNLGGTFGLGFHLADAFLSLFIDISMHVHINTNSSQMLSLYAIFFSSSYWGKLYIGSDDIVRSILFFSFPSAYSPTKIFTQYVARCLDDNAGNNHFLLRNVVYNVDRVFFLWPIWNRSIEIDQEREREKKETKKTTVLFLYSFRKRRSVSSSQKKITKCDG
jgi:hypothetical protein